MKVTLINTQEVKDSLALAGWMGIVSTGKAPEEIQLDELHRIAKNCIDSGHLTVTRPVLFIFRIEGVSRAMSHQFVREEVGVFKVQESQRYVKMDKPDYVTPPSIAKLDGLNSSQYVEHIQSCWRMYKHLVDLGVPAEDARFVIPNAATTKFHVALSFEAMKRIAGKRLCERAQWEIRAVIGEMCRQICEVQPYFKEHFVPQCESLMYCPEKKGCGKMLSKEEARKRLEEVKNVY